MADVVTLERRRAAVTSEGDERAFFPDTIAEYQWARDVAGLAPSTLDQLIKPVIEVSEHYGTVAWRLEPRQVDRYFSGVGKRAAPWPGSADDPADPGQGVRADIALAQQHLVRTGRDLLTEGEAGVGELLEATHTALGLGQGAELRVVVGQPNPAGRHGLQRPSGHAAAEQLAQPLGHRAGADDVQPVRAAAPAVGEGTGTSAALGADEKSSRIGERVLVRAPRTPARADQRLNSRATCGTAARTLPL
ncbi:hypothetical protein [Amycolatopsis magusensis]|uniref:DUF222 domain-containing protein n=1 Tax=Amycolatopsis magusensis TaxID=882444 RepID=A0ABS4PVU5_9PSEU|nr:hypothetical protein [Amycolatopsis magusensis]MBP2182979.1 hypothetical protein [Amycolatopsis magusensis]